jgi:hypothetical protein
MTKGDLGIAVRYFVIVVIGVQAGIEVTTVRMNVPAAPRLQHLAGLRHLEKKLPQVAACHPGRCGKAPAWLARPMPALLV